MTIQDLSVLLAAIDVAVKRGTFSVLEVGQVSAVAEKLNNFLIEAKNQAEAQQAEQQTAESQAADSEQAAA